MLQKLILTLVVIFALTATSFSQNKVKELTINGGCNYYGESFDSKIYTFESDQAAIDAIDKILDPTGLVRNFDIRAADVSNAAAVIIPGDTNRYILYNQAFMRRVKNETNTDWAAISIMAHEIGHHLNGHTLVPGGSRPPTELEADSFSGFVLYKMGATLEEAQAAMNAIASEKGSATHPPKRSRLLAIEAGWTKAKDQDKSSSKVPTTPRTSPDTSSGEIVSACGFSFGRVISKRWLQIGGATGLLGCPTSNELDAEKSPQGTTGRFVRFDRVKFDDKNNGAIYWHKTGRYAGETFIVIGGILNLYEDMGRSSSWLGFPISDEYNVSGGARSDFEGGYIFWSSQTWVSRAFKYN